MKLSLCLGAVLPLLMLLNPAPSLAADEPVCDYNQVLKDWGDADLGGDDRKPGLFTLEEAIQAGLKSLPDLRAAQARLDAAQVRQGTLLSFYAPVFQLLYGRTWSYATTNIPGWQAPTRANAVSGGFVVPLTPLPKYEYGIARIGTLNAKQEQFIQQNSDALLVLQNYLALAFARQKLYDIGCRFLPVLKKMRQDPLNRPEVPGLEPKEKERRDGIKSDIIAAAGTLLMLERNIRADEKTAEHSLQLLIDFIPEQVDRPKEILVKLPPFENIASVSRQVLAGSPLIREAMLETDKAALTHKKAKWNFFDLSAGPNFSRGTQNYSAPNPPGVTNTTGGVGFQVGATWSWGDKKEREATRLDSIASQADLERAKINVRLGVESDYGLVGGLHGSFCINSEALKEKFAKFKRIVGVIDTTPPGAPQAYDPENIIGDVQTWTTTWRFYMDSFFRPGLYAIGDIHASIGNLTEPDNWKTGTLDTSKICADDPSVDEVLNLK